LETTLKMILIEDSEDDSLILLRVIKNAGYILHYKIVETSDGLLSIINSDDWDIIITDNEMPNFCAEKAIQIIRDYNQNIPIIIVSGHISEEQIVKFMKAGAADYISKDNFTRLVPSIEREVREAKNRIEAHKAKLALSEAEKSAEALINATTDAAILMDRDAKVLSVNKIMASRFNLTVNDMFGKSLFTLFPDDEYSFRRKKIIEISYSKQPGTFLDFRDGMWLENSVFPLIDDNGDISKVALFSRDITDKKNSEDNLNLQKAFMQKLFDEAPVAIAIVDNNWQIMRINYEFEQLFGYSDHEAISRSIDELIIPDGRTDELSLLKNLPVSQRSNSFDTIRKTKSGDLKNVVLITKPIVMEENHIALFAMFIDVTALKKVENALVHSEEKYKAITHFTPNIAIQSFDKNGIINFWNKASENIYGYLEEEVLGKNIDDYVVVNNNSTNMVDIINHINTQNTFFGPKEIEASTKTGNIKTILSTIFKIPELSGDGSFICMDIDISDRKEAENQISKLNSELERKVNERTSELNSALAELKESNTELSLLNDALTEESRKLLFLNEKLAISEFNLKETIAAKDKFISIIAHDLKNPLQVLMLSSDILIRYGNKIEENQKIKEYNKIFNSAANLSQLLNDILQWAMAQSGRIEYKPELNDIFSIISEVILLMNEFAAKKSILIESTILPNTFLLCDKNMMTAIFRNLLSNAIKFTPQGGAIVVSCNFENSKFRICFKDNGIGIKQDLIEKLFRIDVNISTLGTSKEKGTGLGLILCKEFMEKHSGKILIQSELGIGSTFILEFPYTIG
jgi:PAS domain S-box-containing protein